MARGLFRIWLIGTSVWFGLLIFSAGLGPVIEKFQNAAAIPAAILAVGAGLVWAFKGFSA